MSFKCSPPNSNTVTSSYCGDHIISQSLNRQACKFKQTETGSLRLISKNRLNTVDWSIFLTLLLYQSLCHTFGSIYDDGSMVSKRNSQSWINKKKLSRIFKRDQLFRAWKKSLKNVNKHREYTRYRNKLNKIIKVAKMST